MLYLGNNLEVLKSFDENSIDAVVTDPPYGLSFMGKAWDYDVPKCELWREVLRVLKPGGHMLAFFGTRTYHRGVVAIEDAGFEIRDQLQWIYGSGFPKSLNIGKAIDKANGISEWKQTRPNPATRPGNGKDAETSTGWAKPQRPPKPIVESDLAKLWDGWGTALKPANEPIVLARKPLSESTVAKNVLRWGTGAINVDESRIATTGADRERHLAEWNRQQSTAKGVANYVGQKDIALNAYAKDGRWPANVLFDESAAEMLDAQSGDIRSRHGTKEQGYTNGGTGSSWMFKDEKKGAGKKVVDVTQNGYLGGASRFFYVAKASKSERNKGLEGMPERIVGTLDGNVDHEHGNRKIGAQPDKPTKKAQNHHPTVKPVKLMQYLIKLITPPKGTVLDPFMGSGSTGVAATALGFKFIGIELNQDYFDIANKRISNEKLV